MAEPAGPSQSDAGFFEHSRELLSGLAAYASARLRLAGIETKEALIHLGIVLALVAGAFGVIALGYLFLCIGLIVLLARVMHVHPEWVILAFALVHFATAIVCLLIAKARLSTPMFSASLDELKKDQQWLNTSKTN